METKNQIFRRYETEYRRAQILQDKQAQTRILDAVVDVTQMNRKAAIRKFARLQTQDPALKERRGRPRTYTPDVICALKEVWEASNRLCGELLFSVIHEYVDILRRDKLWNNTTEATNKLLAMSLGSLKAKVRAFSKARNKGRGFSSTTPSHLKHIIPVFNGPWDKEMPGSEQVDTVAHCGSSLLGTFVYTLNSVDIPTLWDGACAQWNKGQEATVQSLNSVEAQSPFPWNKIHPDTGAEFINWHCKAYCDTKGIKMTRSRPNHSNDNAYIEERNGHIVRKYIGYIRLDCPEAVDALNDVYAVLCPYLNHFIPSRKCIEKVKIGSKYVKKYDKGAKTPYQRVLENEYISEEAKTKLKAEHALLNPLKMKKEIDRLRMILYDVQ
ncbi:MAG: hypothetical protein NUW00_03695, partial [Candidatus Kaiserbacteria bacterium]|nr:hypothetical protein [Candidatus Kaiserbacteria bacterium]